MRSLFLLLFFFTFFLSGAVSADSNISDGRLEIEEKLGQMIPLYATFHDEKGNVVILKDIIRRPTIVSLVYLSCSHTCPALLGDLAGVLGKLDLNPSKDYTIITISFDENDTPEVAREKKKNYISAIAKPFPETTWQFLTGDRENIRKFTDAVGFNFRREKNGFAHPVALIVLSPEGKIVRYLYGQNFLPFDLTMALAEASKGKVGLSVQRLYLFCFSYDQPGRRYVYNILKIYGTVMILLIISFFAYLTLTRRKSGEN